MNFDDYDLADKCRYRGAYGRASREIEIRKRAYGLLEPPQFEQLLAHVARLERQDPENELVKEGVLDALEGRRPQW